MTPTTDAGPPEKVLRHPIPMLSLCFVALFSAVATAQLSSSAPPGDKAAPSVESAASLSELPPIPRGRSTVIGGVIRDVDPVRDQFVLKVFGGKPMKILYDERTKVYRNGTKVSVLDLRPEDHASVETTLDGTAIFALRIHSISQMPGDEIRGQVSSYNSRTGELTIQSDASHAPMTLHVPDGTPVVSIGQDGSSTPQQGPASFARGSVVDVKFTGSGGRGTITNVDVLAAPGSTFVFAGKLSFLDLHAGQLVIVDPRDGKSYPISFDPTLLPEARKLHEGSSVKVTTSFDGQHYVANEIIME